MSVIRVSKSKESPYVMLDTTALNDRRLSFRAKGLHAYLMARPDDWQVRIDHLAKLSDHEGKHAIRSALHELEEAGYIRRHLIHSDGRLRGWETVVFETPTLAKMADEDAKLTDDIQTSDFQTSEKLTSEKLTSEEQRSEKLTSENRTLLINDFTQYGVLPSIESIQKIAPGSSEDEPAPPPDERSPKKRPKSQQPGTLQPELVALITSMKVEEFHCLAKETKLNEDFWDAQILDSNARHLDFPALIRDVDKHFTANRDAVAVSENGARKQMKIALEIAMKKQQAERRRSRG